MNARLVCPSLRIRKDANILLCREMKESLCFCLTKVKNSQGLLKNHYE